MRLKRVTKKQHSRPVSGDTRFAIQFVQYQRQHPLASGLSSTTQWEHFMRNADAIVRHVQSNLAAAKVRRYNDALPRLGVLCDVGQEIRQYLPEAHLIGIDDEPGAGHLNN
jgi:hypothetical protein